MATVSQKLGAYKLCPFITHRAFLIARVSVLGTCFSLRTFEKNKEEPHYKGKQMRRTFATLLHLRASKKQQPRCPAALIISRANSYNSNYNSPLHTSKTTYYDMLRVSPNATQAQIKTAYYRQCFLFHPDRNAGNDEAVRRFSEISEAYTILKSVSLRRKYDRGVLSLLDVQSAGKDTAHHSTPGQQQHQQHHQQQQHQHHQWSSRNFRGAGEKPMFDFDAFYQAHYGEQLEREQSLRQWRERRRQAQQQDLRNWKLQKKTEMVVGALLLLGVVFLFSLKS